MLICFKNFKYFWNVLVVGASNKKSRAILKVFINLLRDNKFTTPEINYKIINHGSNNCIKLTSN